MDADLDTLCTVVYCTADDLLPRAGDESTGRRLPVSADLHRLQRRRPRTLRVHPTVHAGQHQARAVHHNVGILQGFRGLAWTAMNWREQLRDPS